MTKIELLAPAKDLQVGKAAIDSGADAVYIGAPQFGARQAAGNSLDDIRELCHYAHLFDVRVWVTMNTILTDAELPLAERLAWQLYEAGVDGLIVQDMGLLTCNLPPIRLHASTQCNNRSIEKVQWLEKIGFKRVVLARELSLQEIQAIHNASHIELEAFVHGALCVSYSGQCYMSEAMCGRSANKGACAQMCRQRYDLLDKDMHLLQQDVYLLSLHDMDRSHSLRELLAAGVTSLKIEGRLKDENYVRNIVSYYRQVLDAIFSEADSPYCAASKGFVSWDFTPTPAKTFHRGGTDYFLHKRNAQMSNFLSPKSTGEKVGVVLAGGKGCKRIRVEHTCELHNGDGLCYGDKGFLINKVEGDWVYPNQAIDIEAGTVLYRNLDKVFMQALEQTRTRRRVPVAIVFVETEDGFSLQIDSVKERFVYEKQPARNTERAEATIREQLSKLGDTILVAKEIVIDWSAAYFLPISVLNEWRRSVVEKWIAEAAKPIIQPTKHERQSVGIAPAPYPTNEPVDYRLNVMNEAARKFYQACGVNEPSRAFEQSHETGAALMTCRYCLLHELGQCRKTKTKTEQPLPAYIRTSGRLFRLMFDCQRCEMRIYAAE